MLRDATSRWRIIGTDIATITVTKASDFEKQVDRNSYRSVQHTYICHVDNIMWVLAFVDIDDPVTSSLLTS